MNVAAFLFSDLAEVARVLSERHPAVVRDILESVGDDEAVRELVADGVASLVSSSVEPDAWIGQLVGVLMAGRSVDDGALDDDMLARWGRCFSSVSD